MLNLIKVNNILLTLTSEQRFYPLAAWLLVWDQETER